MPPDIDVEVAHCPRPSTGILNRIVNILWARRHQADVNHITGDVHYLAIGLDPRRTILTVADCVSLHYSRGVRRWLIWLFWYWLPVRRSARVVAISEFTRRELQRYLSVKPDKVDVIHCPVPDGFLPMPPRPDNGIPVILQVGTGRNKNLETVVESLGGLPCVVDIVGGLTNAQREMLDRVGIDWRGHAHLANRELQRLYRNCDLVLFVSRYEGFGLPIVEAQATGRPVITSNRCSMPEVAGAGACLVDPSDDMCIKEAIVSVLNNERYRQRLVAAGSDNVARFNANTIASSYCGLYRGTAARDPMWLVRGDRPSAAAAGIREDRPSAPLQSGAKGQ
jgi:glycosyltransferase involved in cell wall biosynthesis